MTESFFPFRLYSSEQGHNPDGFRAIFNKNRPKYIERVENKGTKFEWTRREDFSYYSYDVIILSQTEVEFVCFDIYDFCFGGKGKEFYRFRVTVDKSVAKSYIESRLFARGMDRRVRELEEEERKICKRYANEERKALGITFHD